MTSAEARVLLENMTAWDDVPALTTPEVDSLLALAGSELLGWNLDLAAAEGWRWKAGKVAGKYTFSIDSQQSNQREIYLNCIMQAGVYAERADAVGGSAIAALGIVSSTRAASDQDDTVDV